MSLLFFLVRYTVKVITTDTAVQSSPAAEVHAKSEKAKKEKKVKNPKAKPSHPPTSEMVGKAIKDLKERVGSSLQAIKKYIAANYKVDADKLAPFIRKYLKSAVASGSLVQTKGKGASGPFRLASGSVQVGGDDKKPAAKKVKRAVAGDKPKAAAAAKKPATKPKKAPCSPKAKKPVGAGARKKPASAAAKLKSPSKEKKAKAGPTNKPKAPKPKTAKKKAAASPKKK